MMGNTNDIVEAVAQVALNCKWTDQEVTPSEVAYMCEVSEEFAAKMIQYWEGYGSPVGEP